MKLLNKISSDPRQQFSVIGEAGEQISLFMYFMPSQNAWMCDISWNDFKVTGLQIVVGPNILRRWQNVITFGFACYSTDAYDPQYIEDFLTGRIRLYILSSDDVAAVEAGLF